MGLSTLSGDFYLAVSLSTDFRANFRVVHAGKPAVRETGMKGPVASRNRAVRRARANRRCHGGTSRPVRVSCTFSASWRA
ncbi:hypothetical protein Bxe_A2143 [Paraburkholderia xenovorans LB400]|uniref:Uncharacterized protein n=1 Tax=Paraburkholderia xenovorans (strain LB400) TaxID=266265 RepID=Q13YL4_PARXL|nr:hypothetical protein Bxe_A2143 [Paraburkholderia xenovorans LB400]